jgi:tripartite-type tricarboxylate transporter receptor subunit TctC
MLMALIALIVTSGLFADASWAQNTPSSTNSSTNSSAASSSSNQPLAAWPTKPIRLIVGFAPGGGTDVVARAIAPKIGEILGQSFIVENKTGAAGAIAADYVAKSSPDGYTLLMGHCNSNAIAPFVLPKVPYNATTDFTAITYLGYSPNVLVINSALPVSSVAELIAYAKAKPGALTYGSSGIGSTQHLMGALFAQVTSTDLRHVPYKGSGQAIVDLLANQISMNFDTPPPVLEQIKKGSLKALAVSTPKRLQVLPSVPTFVELGFNNFDITNWYGVMGPRDLNPAIVSAVDRAVKLAMQDPSVKKVLEAQGLQTEGPSTPVAFRAFALSEYSKFQKMIKTLDIKSD